MSAARLSIPSKASGEYQKGCGAFKNKKWPDAEAHLHRAIEEYPAYAAAWVVLGQVLDSEEKRTDAKQACAKAEEVDPHYMAPYLCLAEFAVAESDWAEVGRIAAQALAIDPTGNPYAHYYAADAGLHQHQLAQAEQHAKAAMKLDEWHHIPELHLLLAKIYEASGSAQGAMVQLREFLKEAANSKDAPEARNMLAQLQAAPTSKDTAPAVGQPGK